MATAIGTSVEEYLRTAYEPDCDYLDGELEERNGGKRDHSYLQAATTACLFNAQKRLGCHVFTEQRLRISPARVRIPDVCMVLGALPDEQVFEQPPFLCVEILSPEDRVTRMQAKIRDHITFGVEAVHGMLTSDPEITVTVAEVLP